jgi:hypothetical protein
MDEFLAALLLAALKFARKVFGDDDERVCLVQTTAWFLWHTAPEEVKHLAPAHWAKLAVRRVKQRRDLPGVKKYNDPMDKAIMQPVVGVRCKRPGPLAQLIHKEELDRMLANATEGERKLCEAIQDGVYRTDELAVRLNVSNGRVSQLKRQLAEKHKRN